MRKQRSPCTLSSYENLSDCQISSVGSYNYEDQSYSNALWPQFLTLDVDQRSKPYQDFLHFDISATGDPSSHNVCLQNMGEFQTAADENYLTYNSYNPAEPFLFLEQPIDDSYNWSVVEEDQGFARDSFQQQVLQYGIPSITDYGAVALLLRHLIRVDLTSDGSVSVYNFPAMSITTLNAAGNKCYVKHPNGRVFQEGPMVHMMTGNDRLVKISRRGITFSSSLQSLAYFVDESGTKTTTAKFTDLSEDLTMDVFYDGNRRNCEDLGQECYKMVSEAAYQNYPDGSEMWVLGRIRIKQDRWGEVTVSQYDGRRTITTSPTIRRVTIESPSVSISIDCYSKNYFNVRKDSCLVSSGFCGLIVQNRTQRAGLDRSGRLVLF